MRRMTCRNGFVFVAAICLGLMVTSARSGDLDAPAAAAAAEFYVAPDGKAGNAGTKKSPWDIASVLGGKQKVEPGATIRLAAGTYKAPDRSPASKGFAVRLAGAKGKPVTVRPMAGARVTIDGGLYIQIGADWLVVRDLEITVCELRSLEERTTKISGSAAPTDVARPWGGLEVIGGKNCKYINLVIHDNAQGCGFWIQAEDCELYGCLIYDNGWVGPDRGHGHCIYSQNKDGLKIIADNILVNKYEDTYSIHAYGSSNAYVDNYLIEGNIAYGGGSFLVGGGKPSHNIRIFGNCLYSGDMQIGYNAPENEDCEILDNVIVNGGLIINKYKKVINEGNLILAAGAPRPAGAKVVLRPNKYDPARANLAIYNWDKAPSVEVNLAGFLKDGEKFRLMDPKDFFGKPMHQGACQGGEITVPMKGEFAAFVVLKGE